MYIYSLLKKIRYSKNLEILVFKYPRAYYHQAPFPRHWNGTSPPTKYRIFSFFGISATLTGAIITQFLESFGCDGKARDLLSAEIHLISCLSVFNTGITSGIESAINSGLLPRRLDWRSHLKHMGGVSTILLACFASGLSYNSPRDSLYLLLILNALALVNDKIFKQQNLPHWLFRFKKNFVLGLAASCLVLLTCESQQLPGRAVHIDR